MRIARTGVDMFDPGIDRARMIVSMARRVLNELAGASAIVRLSITILDGASVSAAAHHTLPRALNFSL